MTLSVSETSVVSPANVPQIHLGTSQIVLRSEDQDSVLDLEEYCSNREVVNLENAAVNIDNSNDVIIGPVTQFNVNGNVTIYTNGTDGQDNENAQEPPAINGTTNGNARIGRLERSESADDQDVANIQKHKKAIKISLLVCFSLLVATAVIILAWHFTNSAAFNDTPDPTPSPTDDLGDHHVYDRTQWNGRQPIYTIPITKPVPMVIIKHTGGGQCHDFQECAGKMQTLQSQSFTIGLPDIYYSFLIASDGNIYVGRGWDVQPAQINDTIDIAFFGLYSIDILTPTMTEAAQLLLQYGMDNNKLTEDYILVAHNQTTTTESPGPNIYKDIVHWPHYDGRSHIGGVLKSKVG